MIVAGFGFRAAAKQASLADALEKALFQWHGATVQAFVTESTKSRAAVFQGLAQ